MTLKQRFQGWVRKMTGWPDDVVRVLMGHGRSTASGEIVTPERSLQLVAVWACVSLLADLDASMPVDVLQKQNGGRSIKVDHPLDELLNWEPNAEMSAFDYRRLRRLMIELEGNFVVQKVTDRSGRVLALWPLPWRHIRIERAKDVARTLLYHYQPGDGEPARTFTADQVEHHRGLSLDGVIGLSPIEQAAESLGVAMATQKYGAKWFSNGAQQSLLLLNKADRQLSEKAEENLLTSLRQNLSGIDNAHGIGLIQGNFDMHQIGVPPEQSQFLETRGFNETQIARLYRIPPHIIGITEKVTSFGAGLESQNLGMLTYTVGPRVIAVEKQERRSLLTPAEKRAGMYLKHNVASLLRADIKSRYEAHRMAIDSGWRTPNEVRALEDENPMPGLDLYRIPLNTAYIDDSGAVINPNNTNQEGAAA